MNRPISTRAHGVIDYAWATIAAALPEAMDGAGATARLLRRAGFAATMSSLVTNYEAGVVPVMPMKAHLALDIVLGGALIASPFYLPASERRWAAVPVALGLAGLVAGVFTETRSPREVEGRDVELDEIEHALTGDADLTTSAHLRRYAE